MRPRFPCASWNIQGRGRCAAPEVHLCRLAVVAADGLSGGNLSTKIAPSIQQHILYFVCIDRLKGERLLMWQPLNEEILE